MNSGARESESEVRLVPESPEEFGLRVIWQSEDERMQAAEFMIATRMQEDVRRRVARAALDLREQNRERFFSTFVTRHPND